MSGDYMQGDKDNAVAVPFSDDDTEAKKQGELFADEDAPDASPEERKTRKEKRQQRLTQLWRDGEETKKKYGSLQTEHEDLKRQLAELRGFVAANQNARPQPANDNAKDPYEAQLDAVYARQQEAYTAAQAEIKAGTFDDKRQKHYEQVAREIERDKTQIHAAAVMARQEGTRKQEQAQQVWVQKYPEVYGDQRAYQYAEATAKQRVALGETWSNQLVDEVMNDAMTRFKLGPKKAPSASDKARLSGIGASGNGGGSAPSSSGITMTPELKRMATALYSDLPEADAIKKWVNGPGKRLREKKVI